MMMAAALVVRRRGVAADGTRGPRLKEATDPASSLLPLPLRAGPCSRELLRGARERSGAHSAKRQRAIRDPMHTRDPFAIPLVCEN